jgi:hypothetical protein
MGFTACTEVSFAVHAHAATTDPGKMAAPQESSHAGLQRSADVPRWNKSERETIEEWAEDHEMTFAQAIRRLVELGLLSGKRSK